MSRSEALLHWMARSPAGSGAPQETFPLTQERSHVQESVGRYGRVFGVLVLGSVAAHVAGHTVVPTLLVPPTV